MLDFALSAEGVREAAQAACARARAGLDALAAAPGPDAAAALDRLLGDLEAGTAASTFLKYSSPDPTVRAAAHEAEAGLGRFLVDVYGREDLYAAVKASRAGGLAPDEARLREKTLAEFRRNGLDLPALERARLTVLRKELLELELAYGKNLNEVKDSLAASEDDLAGLPDDFMARLERLPDGRRRLTLDYPDSLPFMANAKSTPARERLYRLMNRRAAPENTALLEEILRLRRRAARLLGYASYAHFVLEERMAKSPEAVAAFLGRLRTRLESKAGAEFARLAALKASEAGPGPLEPWDVSYYHNKLKVTAYDVDEFEVQEYFPAERVVRGVLGLYAGLLGLRFAASDAPAWHADARAFDCLDAASGRTLGTFFLDLHPRDGKFKHAAVFPLVRGRREADGSYRRPSCAMLVNFAAPAGDRPSLLRHAEVETFLHEFGHVMHNLLTESRFHRFAGTRVARDFLEAPSQIMENWAWDGGVLKSISGHWKTGAPLPDALLERMLAARHLDSGVFALRQAAMALIDQALHGPNEADPGETYRRVYGEVAGVALPPDVAPEASFGHLMSYAASYYGYLWSDVYSADMFSVFAAGGDITSSVVGLRYRKTVLAPGGSRDEGTLVREFLGREPSEDAFLKSLGLG